MSLSQNIAPVENLIIDTFPATAGEYKAGQIVQIANNGNVVPITGTGVAIGVVTKDHGTLDAGDNVEVLQHGTWNSRVLFGINRAAVTDSSFHAELQVAGVYLKEFVYGG